MFDNKCKKTVFGKTKLVASKQLYLKFDVEFTNIQLPHYATFFVRPYYQNNIHINTFVLLMWPRASTEYVENVMIKHFPFFGETFI